MTPVVLAISSHVSASTVGLRAITPAVQALGADIWPVPTVLFGLHPGWEGAKGQPLPAADLAVLLDGMRAHPEAAHIGWILTGHFSSPEQIDVVTDAVAALRTAAPGLKLAVDPIMGDADAGLYVREDVAAALADRLVPLADLVTPNAWEAERLTGVAVSDPASARAAAHALARPAAITSVRAKDSTGGRIGAVYIDAEHALYAHAPERPDVPRGTGDLFAGAFVGGLAAGGAPAEALLDAVRRVAGAIAAAEADARAELPASAIARGAAAPAAITAVPV